MTAEDKKSHWETVYAGKPLEKMSWYETRPGVSWELMQELNISPDAGVIDIGGGDSLFTDFLLSRGFTDLSVLDISENALQRARERMGERGNKVNWIASDVTSFQPERKYDLWHDRAALHFLSSPEDRKAYARIARAALRPNGALIVGTFSDTGPEKCSGLTVQRFSEEDMTLLFQDSFRKVKCLRRRHATPTGAAQDFLFCSFRAMS